MSQKVLKVTNTTLKKMQMKYKEFLVDNQPIGSIFVAKKNNCTITAYQSGKVLFQGKSALDEAKSWEKDSISIKKTNNTKKVTAANYSPPNNIEKLSIIGSDEVGTGDYFGPITVVAAFVSDNKVTTLKQLGVKDSKNLNDKQICDIAESIIKLIPYSLLVLHNPKYNNLQESGMTQGRIKALLHNQAINHLIKKVDENIDGALIDQFVVPETYFKHIKGKPKNFSGPYFFSTKAEGVHIAVAAASIIARYAFVKEFDKLSRKAGILLPKGAGSKVDEAAVELIRKKGKESLRAFTKLHFANTEKAMRLV